MSSAKYTIITELKKTSDEPDESCFAFDIIFIDANGKYIETKEVNLMPVFWGNDVYKSLSKDDTLHFANLLLKFAPDNADVNALLEKAITLYEQEKVNGATQTSKPDAQSIEKITTQTPVEAEDTLLFTQEEFDKLYQETYDGAVNYHGMRESAKARLVVVGKNCIKEVQKVLITLDYKTDLTKYLVSDKVYKKYSRENLDFMNDALTRNYIISISLQ
ncbi:hypothetical protein FACS1894111_01590 [Clostridia bacterium]|nr:hypothetical protein FACS1894111_01590 [Clostridia bacterium]